VLVERPCLEALRVSSQGRWSQQPTVITAPTEGCSEALSRRSFLSVSCLFSKHFAFQIPVYKMLNHGYTNGRNTNHPRHPVTRSHIHQSGAIPTFWSNYRRRRAIASFSCDICVKNRGKGSARQTRERREGGHGDRARGYNAFVVCRWPGTAKRKRRHAWAPFSETSTARVMGSGADHA